MQDNFSGQNLSYTFISLAFLYAFNIVVASGLVFLLCMYFDKIQRKNVQFYWSWPGISTSDIFPPT